MARLTTNDLARKKERKDWSCKGPWQAWKSSTHLSDTWPVIFLPPEKGLPHSETMQRTRSEQSRVSAVLSAKEKSTLLPLQAVFDGLRG